MTPVSEFVHFIRLRMISLQTRNIWLRCQSLHTVPSDPTLPSTLWHGAVWRPSSGHQNHNRVTADTCAPQLSAACICRVWDLSVELLHMLRAQTRPASEGNARLMSGFKTWFVWRTPHQTYIYLSLLCCCQQFYDEQSNQKSQESWTGSHEHLW